MGLAQDQAQACDAAAVSFQAGLQCLAHPSSQLLLQTLCSADSQIPEDHRSVHSSKICASLSFKGHDNYYSTLKRLTRMQSDRLHGNWPMQ
jgi:hypothetical protein